VPGAGTYWNGAHVAEIYSIGILDYELRLTESVLVRRRRSAIPECVAPPTVSLVAVDSPASRKRPVAICKRSLPQRVCTARLSRQLQGLCFRTDTDGAPCLTPQGWSPHRSATSARLGVALAVRMYRQYV
jgi:hypothetical protein